MHTITSENNQIKVSFDKELKGWQWDKGDLKYNIDSYKDHSTLLLMPCTLNNYKVLMKTYSNNDNYFFTDLFIENYEKELKSTQDLELKRQLLKERITLDNIDSRKYLLDYSHIKDETIRYPFKHQKLELEYAVRMPAFYSLDEMGLGKTRVAIERHRVLKYKLKRIDKSFIICPVTLMYNWANEIKKWMPENEAKYMLITGTKQEKLDELMILKDSCDFFIINFEGIESIKDELLNLVNERTNIIIDEFIKIKNPTANRSKNLVNICNQTNYVMGLCGTPVSQGSIDLFSPNLCIDKGKKYGFSYDRFIEKYFWRSGWKLIPKKGSYEELSNKLYENALRFTKKECLDIPDKMYNTIEIELPQENQRVYDQMVTFCLSELDGQEVSAPIILVQLLRLSQITSGFIKNPANKIIEFKKQPKLNALSDILDSNNGTQMVIWSRFVRDIKAIANLCLTKNISFGCLVGSDKDFNNTLDAQGNNKDYKNSPIYELYELIKPDSNNPDDIKSAYKNAIKKYHPDWNKNLTENDIETLKRINALYNQFNKFQNMIFPNIPDSAKENFYNIPDNLIGKDSYTRQNIVDKFQAGKLQLIIGTAATGGLGINLTNAERVIYYANDYSLINRLQSEDRVHRAGQTNKVSYYDIVAKDTIDIGILQILMQKKNIADIVTRDNLKNMMKGN